MDIDVYSLAQRAPVKLSAVRAAITDRKATLPEFYDRCRAIFPLVLAPMTVAEIAGQRSLTGFEPDNFHKASERSDAHGRMKLFSMRFHDDGYHLPAKYLPDWIPELPLYRSWRNWGQALFGNEDYMFGLTETLRRDAAPINRVIGDLIHGDCTLEHGYGYRAVSLFNFCTDAALATPADDKGAWWATQWCDMGAIPFKEIYELKKLSAYGDEAYQTSLVARCETHPLPANHHIVMPTWMMHRASNFLDAPEDYDDQFSADRPQPKAYVAHTKLRITEL